MSDPAPPFDRHVALLEHGELEIVAQLVQSSNISFVMQVTDGEDYAWAIYKPLLGEQPLYDFPPGLHVRERAAYLLAEHLGWHLVPPTVIREDGPFGVGSLQWFIDHRDTHYLELIETRRDLDEQFQRIAVFDMLVNNTDRKSGHVLLDAHDHPWGIDHGLCFHEDPKLRTVIWDYAGEPMDPALVAAVEPLIDAVPTAVADLLSVEEVEALQRRASRIERLPTFPQPRSHRQFPWPLV